MTKFWIIAFNRAVEIINNKIITGLAFADDLCALLGSDDLNFMTKKTQKMLDELTDQGSTCSLKFSSGKTVAILFTKKKKLAAHKLKIYGKNIEYQKSTKYLGLTINSKLARTEHITNTLNTNLAYLRKLINKT